MVYIVFGNSLDPAYGAKTSAFRYKPYRRHNDAVRKNRDRLRFSSLFRFSIIYKRKHLQPRHVSMCSG